MGTRSSGPKAILEREKDREKCNFLHLIVVGCHLEAVVDGSSSLSAASAAASCWKTTKKRGENVISTTKKAKNKANSNLDGHRSVQF